MFIDGKTKIRIMGKPKLTNPKDAEAFRLALEDGDLEINIKGSLGYNRHKIDVPLLKIGYLLMFSRFGYRYILSKPLEMIRQQLLNPTEHVIEPITCTVTKCDLDQPFKVLYAHSPSEYRCFMVLLKIPDTDDVKAIVLPDLTDFECAIYNRIYETKPIFDLSILKFKDCR